MTQIQKLELAHKISMLKPSEVIMAMVNGLKQPFTEIDMTTYGEVREEHKQVKLLGIPLYKKKEYVCYGCAATNAVLHLNGKLDIELVKPYGGDPFDVDDPHTPEQIIITFERAINLLRVGNIYGCNNYLNLLKIDAIIYTNKIHQELCELYSNYQPEQLTGYEKLAEYNKTLENQILSLNETK